MGNLSSAEESQSGD